MASCLHQAEDSLTKYESDVLITDSISTGTNKPRRYKPYTRCIAMSLQVFMENPISTPLIPNWNRVIAAIPDIFDMLEIAVVADSK